MLSRGDILGVVGPNGAGKTTLINMLAGIYEKDSGNITYFGIPFTNDAIDIKKRIGILPDQLGLFEQLRGEEYLYFVARLYGLSETCSKKYIEELFHFMDMEGDERNFIHQYSTGMKKKIAIAAILIHSPDILIMDEPFENIDPISMKNINNCLQKLARGGATIVVTSQILHSLDRICSDVLVIDEGKEILFDKTSNIQNHISKSKSSEHNPSLEHLFFEIMKTRDQKMNLSWI
jgi:ABC-2 type transport system ATP-binding protein